MIYDYIERERLRRAIILANLFYEEQLHISELSNQLSVSVATIRNDLIYLEKKLKEEIENISTYNGVISIHLKENIHLSLLLYKLLQKSLFVKFLFISLFTEPATVKQIADIEDISAAKARRVFNDVQQFLEEEFPDDLSDNDREIKRRSMIICLSPYVNLKEMAESFDTVITEQAIEVLKQIVDFNLLTMAHKIPLFVAIYLSIDNALIHNIKIDYRNPLLRNTIFNRQLKKELAPFIQEEHLDDECCYLSLIFSNRYRAYFDDPTRNSNLQYFDYDDVTSDAVKELVLTLEFHFNIDKKHPLFYSSIQKFLVANWLKFPFQLTFYRSHRYSELYYQLTEVLEQWNEKHQLFAKMNVETIYTFASYLEPLVKLTKMSKTILITAPSTELYNIYRYAIEHYFANNVVTIDTTPYTSIDSIPQELLKPDTVIVCDRAIAHQVEEPVKVAPFSVYTLKENLIQLNDYF